MKEDYNDPITWKEFKDALRTCTDSAPGRDSITYSIIKKMDETTQLELLEIFNAIWLQGEFPNEWRKANVLSFPKPQKEPTQKTNQRPIALTSSLCKLMEKIVNVRLMRTIEKKDILSEFQFAFRKHRSTIDAFIKLQTDVLNTFARKEHLVAVFFDIQKAYDTAWRYGILKTIHKAGIKGPLAWFIQNFLRERKFRTIIGNTASTEVTQQQGVPQGSVLSCSLFILAINDVLQDLPTNVKASLYVDDLVIYSSSHHIPAIERRLQLAICKIQAWANTNGFRFSTTKTTALHFHRKRGLQQEPSLKLYADEIKFNQTATYLGMIFDQRMRWKEHIDHLKMKCTKSLACLERNGEVIESRSLDCTVL